MPVAALCASHTPLKDYVSPGVEVAREVAAGFARLKNFVDDYAPELVVVIGPDHFNGFFYQNLPSFCVGAGAEAVGDWKTPRGRFQVATEIGERCVRALQQNDVDSAISYHMWIDHGGIQIIDQLFDWNDLPQIVPVFINCAAPPLPPLKRVRALGTALGNFLATLEQRVLVIGSGGISHDPPIPKLANAEGAVRERLIYGGVLSAEARNERQQRVIDAAHAALAGTSVQVPLNAQWDRQFLEHVAAADFDSICALDDDSISRDGGCGGHEIRTWIAANVAARTAGASHAEVLYYRAISEWIAGFGIMTLR